MSDDVETIDKESREPINIKDDDKQYKTKSYIRNAQNRYRRKKYAEDPEFKQKYIATIIECQTKNIDQYREYRRNYMKQYRERKKQEIQEKQKADSKVIENPSDKPITENLDSLTASISILTC